MITKDIHKDGGMDTYIVLKVEYVFGVIKTFKSIMNFIHFSNKSEILSNILLDAPKCIFDLKNSIYVL